MAENIPCGSDGVTCTKSITVKIRNMQIHMVRGNEPVVTVLHEGDAKVSVVEVGLFYMVMAEDDGKI